MIATYTYKAFDPVGKLVHDVIGAGSKAEAIDSLRSLGFNPVSVEARGTTFDVGQLFARRSQQRLVMFRSLAQLMRGGVSVEEAFDVIIKQAKLSLAEGGSFTAPWTRTGKERFLRSLVSLRHDVSNNGVPLHEAMSRRPNEFTAVEAAMVEAGAETGQPDVVYEQIAKFLDLERKTARQLKDALVYPAVVLLVAIGVIIYILVSVVPQFADFYKGFDVPLPGIMTFLLGVSSFLSQPLTIGLIVGALGFGIYALAKYLGTPDGALAFDKTRMKIPVLGQFFSKAIMVRMCRVLAMLFNAGKIHTDVLEIAAPVVGSPLFEIKLRQVRRLLDDGVVANLHEAFERSGEFDAMLIGMMGVGAKTGDYASPLEKISEWYEQDVESIAATLPNILQTVITIGLGAVVGLVVSAIYVPLANLSGNIH